MFSRAGYALKQAFSQIGRNKSMYFISVLAITAMMLILGLFFVAFVNVDMFAASINKDYNVIQVYLDDSNDDVDNEQIRQELEAIDGVNNTVFESKEAAMETLRERWGDNGYLLDNLKDNPLPDSFLVYVDDKEAADTAATESVEISGVNDVTYYQDTIDKLSKVTHFVEVGSLISMVFLIVVSVIIVANTIKLTVHNRSKEIGIMKYLGATDWFVRTPFLLGGIFVGLVSSAVATGLIYVVYSKVVDLIGADIVRMLSVNLVSTDYLVKNLLVMFIALGVGIGTCGSIISIRRFLAR